MKFVTVFLAFSPAEAELIGSRLEAAGFLVRILHELSALSLDGYSVAAGGIRVQVPDDAATDARELLDSAGQAPQEPGESDAPPPVPPAP